MAQHPTGDLRRTPLHALHVELGARMVGFAGWDMPIQFAGILAEHAHVRGAGEGPCGAGLFDVSHMGQIRLSGEGADAALEALVPADIRGLKDGRTRYTQFTTESGGIIDDLMVTRLGEDLVLVVNAARFDVDLAHLKGRLPGAVRIEVLDSLALLALQGPSAAEVLARHAGGVEGLSFMQTAEMDIAGVSARISRSGYTGEDGFEFAVPADEAEGIARLLLAEPEAAPIGLGARDSLRMEAGLCLYGQDIDETTSPVEAGLAWSIQKRRRAEGGFPGADRILRELEQGTARTRVGLRPDGRAIARTGTPVLAGEERIGAVTSGGFGPSVGGPIAIAYVPPAHAAAGTALTLDLRGRAEPARVVGLPFVPHRYHR